MTSRSESSFKIKDSFTLFLTILSIFVISMFFTGSGAANIKDYLVGDVWVDEDLVAGKDIKLPLSEEEKRKRIENITLRHQDLLVENLVDQAELRRLFEDKMDPSSYQIIATAVHDIYNFHVLENADKTKQYFTLEGESKNMLSTDRVISLKAARNTVNKQFKPFAIDPNLVNEIIVPNFSDDADYRASVIKDLADKVEDDGEVIAKGTTVVASGQKITDANIQSINAVLDSKSKGIFGEFSLIQYLGYLLLTALIIGVLILYLRKYFPELAHSVSGIALILFWPLLFSFLVFIVSSNPALSPYLLPFCVVPIVIKNFFEERLALFIHIVVVLIASYLSGLGYEFTFIQILAGIVTVLMVSETRRWDSFFKSVAFILITYALGFLGINLIQGGSSVLSDLPVFGWLAMNGLLLLLAYPIIPIVERLFGFTSSIALTELNDMNNPLIKEFSTKAPGTLQHSLQVANLAESAAEAIGGNGLLVRTAALYHDIGKLAKPEYFIENNPNNNLHGELNDNFESAQIIIGHVTDGVEMAKENKLPPEITDFILTHHGTTRVEYFYRNEKNQFPEKNVDAELFTYPGPKPKTKEQAILMIADSLEAACKSLKNPSGTELDEFIDKICTYKIESGQLDDSELTFEEFQTVKETMKKMLHSIYHVRVEYPEER